MSTHDDDEYWRRVEQEEDAYGQRRLAASTRDTMDAACRAVGMCLAVLRAYDGSSKGAVSPDIDALRGLIDAIENARGDFTAECERIINS